MLDGEKATIDGEARALVTWRGRLNSDEVVDLIVIDEWTGGGAGELESSVYVGCGGDEYALVYGPAYSLGLEPVPGARDAGFLRLHELRRTASLENARQAPATLRYAGGRYTATRAPSLGGP